eukprot:CAMPEP_0176169718 /NCGR_PEP_ID=MMETSP0120_2-20121206/86883_1 /TAXON_ID=160619 /ORGANISM="Kryptoperidinium foliaceum, Strain CCMP 1326" /LENGTH=58 /DNA_ID=CAMNT_0017507499 /DNA_START=81 /DNA_END=253 /DNA_ORIENTATION=+
MMSASYTCGLSFATPFRDPSGARTASTLPLCARRPDAWTSTISRRKSAAICSLTAPSR